MVGIILYGSFELAPYAKKYMNILENAKIPYANMSAKTILKAVFTIGEICFLFLIIRQIIFKCKPR